MIPKPLHPNTPLFDRLGRSNRGVLQRGGFGIMSNFYFFVSKGTHDTQRVITPRGLPQQAQMGGSWVLGGFSPPGSTTPAIHPPSDIVPYMKSRQMFSYVACI